MKQLLIGAGSRHLRFLPRNGLVGDSFMAQSLHPSHGWDELTTLDNNKDHAPDTVWDLTDELGLPFFENSFDEIHAYEVLEHTGRQGDYRFFFWQWSDFWRVLKPGGHFYGSVPHWESVWAIGDPSHTRVIPSESFVFLSQEEYRKQVGVTPMSDFRHIYHADFDVEDLYLQNETMFFALKAIKPARVDE